MSETVDIQFLMNSEEFLRECERLKKALQEIEAGTRDSMQGVSGTTGAELEKVAGELNGLGVKMKQVEGYLDSLGRSQDAATVALTARLQGEIDAMKRLMQEVSSPAPGGVDATGITRGVEAAMTGMSTTTREETRKIKSELEGFRENMKLVEQDIAGMEKEYAKATGNRRGYLGVEITAAKKALEEDRALYNEMKQRAEGAIDANRRLSERLEDVRDKMAKSRLAGKENTAEYASLEEQAGKMNKALRDTERHLSALSHETGFWKGIVDGMSGVAGAYGAVEGAMVLFGGENEDMIKIFAKLQAVQGITMGLQQASTLLYVDGAFQVNVIARAKRAWATATMFLNTQLGMSVGLSRALMASGIGLLIAGIGLLVYKLVSLKNESDEAGDAMKLAMDAAGNSYGKAKVELDKYHDILKSETATLKEKINAQKYLVDHVDGYHATLNEEGRLISENTAALEKYNSTLIQKAMLESIDGEMAKAMAGVGMAAREKKKAQEKFDELDPNMPLKKVVVLNSGGLESKKTVKYHAKEALDKANKVFEEANKKYQVLVKEREAIKEELSAINKKYLDEDKTIGAEIARLENEKTRITENYKSHIPGKNDKEIEALNKKYSAEMMAIEKQLDKLRLKTSPSKVEKAPSPGKESKDFEQELTKQEKAFEGYKTVVTIAGKELADDLYGSQVSGFKNFFAWLSTEGLREAAGSVDKQKIVYDRMGKELEKLYPETKELPEDNYFQDFQKLLSECKDVNQQITDITVQYDEEIGQLRKGGFEREANERERQKEERLLALRSSLLKESDLWVNMFGNVENESTRFLRENLKNARVYLDGLRGLSVKQLKEKGISPSDLKALEDAFDRMEEEMLERNPFSIMKDDFAKLLEAIKGGKEVDEVLMNLGGSIRLAGEFIGRFGDNLEKAFGEDAGFAVKQIGELTNAVGDMASGAAQVASGNIIGGAMSIFSGVSSILGMGRKVKEDNRRVRAEMEAIQLKYYLAEFEINQLLRDRVDLEKQIGEGSLKHLARKQQELLAQKAANQREFNELYSRIQQEEYKSGETYKHGTLFRKAKIKTTWDSLGGKTYEQLEALFVAGKLNEKAAQLFEQLRKLKEEGADINAMLDDTAEEFRQLITGTTYDSLVDSIVNGFREGKISARDFAGDFKTLMQNAILESLKTKALEEPLRKLYEKFAKMGEDGYTSGEIDELRNMYNTIITNAGKQFEEMQKITGIDFDSSFTGSGSAGKLQAALTEDTASNVLGVINMIAYDVRAIREAGSGPVGEGSQLPGEFLREIMLQQYKIVNNTGLTAENTARALLELRGGFTMLNGRLERIEYNTRGYNGRST